MTLLIKRLKIIRSYFSVFNIEQLEFRNNVRQRERKMFSLRLRSSQTSESVVVLSKCLHSSQTSKSVSCPNVYTAVRRQKAWSCCPMFTRQSDVRNRLDEQQTTNLHLSHFFIFIIVNDIRNEKCKIIIG